MTMGDTGAMRGPREPLFPLAGQHTGREIRQGAAPVIQQRPVGIIPCRARGPGVVCAFPFRITALDLLAQPPGILGGDAVRILDQPFFDLVDAVPHAGKRPDHAIEVVAALANRRSVLDDVANGPFTIGIRHGPGVFRHQAVEQVVDVRKLVAGADLQPGHRDVSRRPAVELDGRAVLGVLDLEFLVQLGAGATADDPETTPGGGDFGIGAREPG